MHLRLVIRSGRRVQVIPQIWDDLHVKKNKYKKCIWDRTRDLQVEALTRFP